MEINQAAAPDPLMIFFMENDISKIEDEIEVSKRIPYKFKIKALTQAKFNNIQKMCTKISKGTSEFDAGKFNVMAIVEGCTYPNFSDKTFIEKLSVALPQEAVMKCMLPGEIANLAKSIQEISGFDNDLNPKIEEAKNS